MVKGFVVGDIVSPIMDNDYIEFLHLKHPEYYPPVETIGVVKKVWAFDDIVVNWDNLGPWHIQGKYLRRIG